MPNLVNVEKIDNQEQHEKTWFQRFNKKLGVAVTGATALVVGKSANAAEGDSAISFAFIDIIKSALQSAFDGLQSIYGVAILIILAIVVFGVMKGGTRKVG